MKQTKKLTVSSMAVALGVLFMLLGYFVEVLDLTVAALCSLLMVFMCMEVGKPYNFLVWLATSLLGALFFTSSLVWVTYLVVFGIYPIIKGYIERLRRVFWIPVKLVFFLISSSAVIAISEFLLGIPFFGESPFEFAAGYEWIFPAAVYAVLIIAMFVYDVFLTVMVRAYVVKIRPKIKNILK